MECKEAEDGRWRRGLQEEKQDVQQPLSEVLGFTQYPDKWMWWLYTLTPVPGSLSSSRSFAMGYLYDIWQITYTLCDSVSSSLKWS